MPCAQGTFHPQIGLDQFGFGLTPIACTAGWPPRVTPTVQFWIWLGHTVQINLPRASAPGRLPRSPTFIRLDPIRQFLHSIAPLYRGPLADIIRLERVASTPRNTDHLLISFLSHSTHPVSSAPEPLLRPPGSCRPGPCNTCIVVKEICGPATARKPHGQQTRPADIPIPRRRCGP